MPSRHTKVEITSAEISNLSQTLAQARDVLAEWQVSHDRWGLDWDEPDKHYTALSDVLGAIESMKALEKQLWKQHSRKQPGEKGMAAGDKEAFIQRVKDALAPKERAHQPTGDELRALDRDLARGLADALESKPELQPTVASLREHGTKEPEWVQEASAYHRSRDLGEFSDERRAQMEKVPEAVRELGDDDHEMGM